MSKDIIEETKAIVERKFLDSEDIDHAMLFLADIESASEFHNETYTKNQKKHPNHFIRDPKDSVHVIFILAAEPDIFVSGGGDFLEHATIGSTYIMDTRKALKTLGIL